MLHIAGNWTKKRYVDLMYVLGVLVRSRATEHTLSQAKAIQRKSRPTREAPKITFLDPKPQGCPITRRRNQNGRRDQGMNTMNIINLMSVIMSTYEHCEHHGAFLSKHCLLLPCLALPCLASSCLFLSVLSHFISFHLVLP